MIGTHKNRRFSQKLPQQQTEPLSRGIFLLKKCQFCSCVICVIVQMSERLIRFSAV